MFEEMLSYEEDLDEKSRVQKKESDHLLKEENKKIATTVGYSEVKNKIL